jgi:hypothetical protein
MWRLIGGYKSKETSHMSIFIWWVSLGAVFNWASFILEKRLRK